MCTLTVASPESESGPQISSHKLHAGEYLVWVKKAAYIIEETLSEEAAGYPYL